MFACCFWALLTSCKILDIWQSCPATTSLEQVAAIRCLLYTCRYPEIVPHKTTSSWTTDDGAMLSLSSNLYQTYPKRCSVFFSSAFIRKLASGVTAKTQPNVPFNDFSLRSNELIMRVAGVYLQGPITPQRWGGAGRKAVVRGDGGDAGMLHLRCCCVKQWMARGRQLMWQSAHAINMQWDGLVRRGFPTVLLGVIGLLFREGLKEVTWTE